MSKISDATIITATQLHKQRGEILKRCYRDKEHFLIEKDGYPVVAIIPIDEYQKIRQLSKPKTRKQSVSNSKA